MILVLLVFIFLPQTLISSLQISNKEIKKHARKKLQELEQSCFNIFIDLENQGTNIVNEKDSDIILQKESVIKTFFGLLKTSQILHKIIVKKTWGSKEEIPEEIKLLSIKNAEDFLAKLGITIFSEECVFSNENIDEKKYTQVQVSNSFEAVRFVVVHHLAYCNEVIKQIGHHKIEKIIILDTDLIRQEKDVPILKDIVSDISLNHHIVSRQNHSLLSLLSVLGDYEKIRFMIVNYKDRWNCSIYKQTPIHMAVLPLQGNDVSRVRSTLENLFSQKYLNGKMIAPAKKYRL